MTRTFAQEQESYDHRTPEDDGGAHEALREAAHARLMDAPQHSYLTCPGCDELVRAEALDAHADECTALHEAITGEWADAAWEVRHG